MAAIYLKSVKTFIGSVYDEERGRFVEFIVLAHNMDEAKKKVSEITKKFEFKHKVMITSCPNMREDILIY